MPLCQKSIHVFYYSLYHFHKLNEGTLNIFRIYNLNLKKLLNVGFSISHIAEYVPNIKRGFDTKENATVLSFCDLVLHLILSLIWVQIEVRFGRFIYFDSRIRKST